MRHEVRPIFAGMCIVVMLASGAAHALAAVVPEALSLKAARQGSVRVIVQLRVNTIPEGRLQSADAVTAQRRAIAAGRSAVLAELASTSSQTIREFAESFRWLVKPEIGDQFCRLLRMLQPGIVATEYMRFGRRTLHGIRGVRR